VSETDRSASAKLSISDRQLVIKTVDLSQTNSFVVRFGPLPAELANGAETESSSRGDSRWFFFIVDCVFRYYCNRCNIFS
jgi:hypothetical protein